ncbi:ATP-binding cassette domain-containing protein [bacterium]|nr:ATP-binding cassette domain-containing protein [bacterium]
MLGYLRPYGKQVTLGYLGGFFAMSLNLFVPQIIKDAIDNGLMNRQASALFYAGGLILGIAVIRGVAGFAQRYYGEWMSHRVAFDLRNDFYKSVQRLPFAFHDKAQTGDLMSRATSDITESERFIGIGLESLISTLVLLFGVIIAMLLESVDLALYTLPSLVLLVIATVRFGGTVRPMFKKIQEQMGQLSSTMQESMTGIRLVKSFAREPHELKKFDEQNELWFERRFSVIKVWASNWPLFSILLGSAIFILLWFGGPRALAGEITVGSLFALISYVLMLNGPVQRLGFLVNLAATAGSSAERVFEIIDTPIEVEDSANAVELDAVKGEVTFEKVGFRYGERGALILDDINFRAAPGQTIALIGPTGSGKSTVTNLIPRFYDPSQGRICIDGHDIRHVTLDSLRRQIGIVLQDPFLFGLTIAENIAYGHPDATPEQIMDAAKAARAHKFILDFPNGYETAVGERGVTLSGGQKQRVAIARALLYDPRILILDDSTSSVDTETEHLIQEALKVLMQGRTTFIIAQRLLTLKNADQILVLDGGCIVQRGSHDELLAVDGLYRTIYDLQLKDQEEFADTVSRLDDSQDGDPPSQPERRPAAVTGR